MLDALGAATQGPAVTSAAQPVAVITDSDARRIQQEITREYDAGNWIRVADLSALRIADSHTSDTAIDYLQYGFALMHLNRSHEAMKALMKAHEGNPRHIPTMRIASNAALRANDKEVAEGLLKQAVSLTTDPKEQIDILSDYATLLESLGRSQEALNRVDQALRLEPDNTDWIRWRRDLLVKLGHPHQALKDATALVNGANAAFEDSVALARIYHMADAPTEYIAGTLAGAVRLAGSDPEALDELASVRKELH